MKYKIKKLKQAQKEINKLTKIQQTKLNLDYDNITNKGLEFVKTRHLRANLFEIKTDDIRSLYTYQEDCIILIGLIYEKRSNKAPDYYIELAQKRLKEI